MASRVVEYRCLNIYCRIIEFKGISLDPSLNTCPLCQTMGTQKGPTIVNYDKDGNVV